MIQIKNVHRLFENFKKNGKEIKKLPTLESNIKMHIQ